ncbi:MAG: DUF2846 domain-containing protein [Halomonadaceae bacterium]|jgi:hypothetical protein
MKKLKTPLYLISAALVLLVQGCATPTLDGRPYFSGVTGESATSVIVYMYRPMPDTYFSAYPDIHVNGKLAGKLLPDGYMRLELPPGESEFKSTPAPFSSSMKKNEFILNLEKGNTYFISMQDLYHPPSDGKTLGSVEEASFRLIKHYHRFALVSREQALKELPCCREIPTNSFN